MYVLVIALMFPAINGLAIVKIHRDSVYLPESPCALLHNLTLSSQDSLQTCIWKCTHEQDCQTAVYFNDAKVCSMFVEFHRIDRILPSGNVRASVIACQKNHSEFILMSIHRSTERDSIDQCDRMHCSAYETPYWKRARYRSLEIA